jgi:hypothetical protein
VRSRSHEASTRPVAARQERRDVHTARALELVGVAHVLERLGDQAQQRSDRFAPWRSGRTPPASSTPKSSLPRSASAPPRPQPRSSAGPPSGCARRGTPRPASDRDERAQPNSTPGESGAAACRHQALDALDHRPYRAGPPCSAVSAWSASPSSRDGGSSRILAHGSPSAVASRVDASSSAVSIRALPSRVRARAAERPASHRRGSASLPASCIKLGRGSPEARESARLLPAGDGTALREGIGDGADRARRPPSRPARAPGGRQGGHRRHRPDAPRSTRAARRYGAAGRRATRRKRRRRALAVARADAWESRPSWFECPGGQRRRPWPRTGHRVPGSQTPTVGRTVRSRPSVSSRRPDHRRRLPHPRAADRQRGGRIVRKV